MIQTNHTIKMHTIGQQHTGKTSIICRYLGLKNNRQKRGTEYYSKNLKIQRKKIKIEYSDSVGGGMFSVISQLFYEYNQGFFLVYDITNRDSFDKLYSLYQTTQSKKKINYVFILIGNKCDLIEERQVTYEEADEFAKQNGFEFFEVSAKTGQNIQLACDQLINRILQVF